MRHLGVLVALGIAIVGCSVAPQLASASSVAKKSDQTLKIERPANLTLVDTYKKQQTGASIIAKSTEKMTSDKVEKSAEKPVEPAAPVDETVMVKDGDSLTLIATEHGTDWTRLFDANESIADPNTITPGETLRVPRADEQLPDRVAQFIAVQQQAAASTVATAQTQTASTYTTAPVNSQSYYVGNGMWCTDYVHARRPDVPIYGNAGYGWMSAAQAQGRATGNTPRAGAVAVMNGHVAYVESVNADGSYVVSEMGWNYQAGSYNKRTVTPGAFGGFIY